MAYALSFATEFFYGDGSLSPDELPRTDRPTCVYQALVSLPEHDWAALARDVFGIEPERLDPDTVIEKVQATDTCTNLDPPVELWVDAQGWYRLLIY